MKRRSVLVLLAVFCSSLNAHEEGTVDSASHLLIHAMELAVPVLLLVIAMSAAFVLARRLRQNAATTDC